MTFLTIDIKKANKPYGHVGYTRKDPRTGKPVMVKPKGSKPIEQKKPASKETKPQQQKKQKSKQEAPTPVIPPSAYNPETELARPSPKISPELESITSLAPDDKLKYSGIIKAAGIKLSVKDKKLEDHATYVVGKSLEGLGLIFGKTGKRWNLPVIVKTMYDGSNAVYDQNKGCIEIDPVKGKASLYHEFGHFYDHQVGKKIGAEYDEDDYGSNLAGNLNWYKWLRAMETSESYKNWESNKKQGSYLTSPPEMFARFFNQWCYASLAEHGHKPEDYLCSVEFDKEHDSLMEGGEFEKIRPLFERLIARDIKKAFGLFIKSLIVDNEERQQPHMHVVRVKDGHPVRHPKHAAVDEYSGDAWRADIKNKLYEHALTEVSKDTRNLEANAENAKQWLADRGLVTPDADDSLTRKTMLHWLNTYGPIAFALGIQLAGPSGETLASIQELGAIERSVLTIDLSKARTIGSLGYAKWGHITTADGSRHGDLPRAVRTRELMKLASVIEGYRNRGIQARYQPPPGGVTSFSKQWHSGKRQEFRRQLAQIDPSMAIVARHEEKHLPMPPLKDKNPAQGLVDPKAYISALDVIRERVSRWTRPAKYRTVVDPYYKKQLDSLIAHSRTLSSAIKKEITGGKKLKMGTLAATYKQHPKVKEYLATRQAISRLRSKAYPTEGGGLYAISPGELKIIEDAHLPDLGFQMTERPMSYLLSIGWHKQKPNGENSFSRPEAEALLHEYEYFIKRQAYSAARNIVGYQPSAHSKRAWVAYSKLVNEIAMEGVNAANYEMLKTAAAWKTPGEPSANNNFLVYAFDKIPGVIRRKEIEYYRGKPGKQKFEISFEDLEDMPMGASGKKFTPAARIETPEQYYRVRELVKPVMDIYAKNMTPLQYAVVASHFNFLKPNAEETGTYEDKKFKVVTSTGEEKLVSIPGINPWNKVREEVAEFIEAGNLPISASEIESAASKMRAMSPRKLDEIFSTALYNMGQGEGINETERRAIADFAQAQRQYMEGVRHTVWDEPEAARKLMVKVKPVDEREIKKLEAQHANLVRQTSKTVDSKKRAEVHAKQLEVARKLLDLRARRKATERPGDITRRRERLPHKRNTIVFWEKHNGLASAVGVDTNYGSFLASPGIEAPSRYHYDRLKAELYHSMLASWSKLSKPQLRKLAKENPPTSWGPSAVHMPVNHYQEMIKFLLLGNKVEEPGVAKSFVIPDYYAALQGLIEECHLWELNGAF